jgi:hypothetical protein
MPFSPTGSHHPQQARRCGPGPVAMRSGCAGWFLIYWTGMPDLFFVQAQVFFGPMAESRRDACPAKKIYMEKSMGIWAVICHVATLHTTVRHQVSHSDDGGRPRQALFRRLADLEAGSKMPGVAEGADRHKAPRTSRQDNERSVKAQRPGRSCCAGSER